MNWVDFGPKPLTRTGQHQRFFMGAELFNNAGKIVARIVRVMGDEEKTRREIEICKRRWA